MTNLAALIDEARRLQAAQRAARDDLCIAYAWPREIVSVAPLESPSPAFVTERGRVERRAGIRLWKFFMIGAGA